MREPETHRGISNGGRYCTDNDCKCHDPAYAREFETAPTFIRTSNEDLIAELEAAAGKWVLEKNKYTLECLRDARKAVLGAMRAAPETRTEPDRPLAWYRFKGVAGPPTFAWGAWPPPEPDDTVWHPLYASPEGRPAQETSELSRALHTIDEAGKLSDWINRARPVVTDLMQAYERRIRTDCTPEQPNEHHPGPRCSCRECQQKYPTEHGNAK